MPKNITSKCFLLHVIISLLFIKILAGLVAYILKSNRFDGSSIQNWLRDLKSNQTEYERFEFCFKPIKLLKNNYEL